MVNKTNIVGVPKLSPLGKRLKAAFRRQGIDCNKYPTLVHEVARRRHIREGSNDRAIYELGNVLLGYGLETPKEPLKIIAAVKNIEFGEPRYSDENSEVIDPFIPLPPNNESSYLLDHNHVGRYKKDEVFKGIRSAGEKLFSDDGIKRARFEGMSNWVARELAPLLEACILEEVSFETAKVGIDKAIGELVPVVNIDLGKLGKADSKFSQLHACSIVEAINEEITSNNGVIIHYDPFENEFYLLANTKNTEVYSPAGRKIVSAVAVPFLTEGKAAEQFGEFVIEDPQSTYVLEQNHLYASQNYKKILDGEAFAEDISFRESVDLFYMWTHMMHYASLDDSLNASMRDERYIYAAASDCIKLSEAKLKRRFNRAITSDHELATTLVTKGDSRILQEIQAIKETPGHNESLIPYLNNVLIFRGILLAMEESDYPLLIFATLFQEDNAFKFGENFYNPTGLATRYLIPELESSLVSDNGKLNKPEFLELVHQEIKDDDLDTCFNKAKEFNEVLRNAVSKSINKNFYRDLNRVAQGWKDKEAKWGKF